MNQPVNSIDDRPATGSAPHLCGAGPLVPGSQVPSHSGTQLPATKSPSQPVTQLPGRQGAGATGNEPLGRQVAGEPGQQAARSPGRLGTGYPPPKPRKSRRISQACLTREERMALRRLGERNATQWIAAVKAASRTPSLRAQLSAIVLFDHLYDAPEPWKKNRGPLDEWAAEWTPETSPNPAVLARALVRLGFPLRLAEHRAWMWG